MLTAGGGVQKLWVNPHREDRGQGGSTLNPGLEWVLMTSCHPRAAQRAFAEMSGSFYGHDVATKLLRPGQSQVPWIHLLTASRGEDSHRNHSEGIRGTQEYLSHSVREQSLEDFHPKRQVPCVFKQHAFAEARYTRSTAREEQGLGGMER